MSVKWKCGELVINVYQYKQEILQIQIIKYQYRYKYKADIHILGCNHSFIHLHTINASHNSRQDPVLYFDRKPRSQSTEGSSTTSKNSRAKIMFVFLGIWPWREKPSGSKKCHRFASIHAQLTSGFGLASGHRAMGHVNDSCFLYVFLKGTDLEGKKSSHPRRQN